MISIAIIDTRACVIALWYLSSFIHTGVRITLVIIFLLEFGATQDIISCAAVDVIDIVLLPPIAAFSPLVASSFIIN